MKKNITRMFILIFALSACAPAAGNALSPSPSYPNASYPNASYPNPSNSMPIEQNSYAPQPTDANLMRGTAFVDIQEVLTLESFPLQFTLHLAGSLPTPCNQLRVAVSPPDTENKILVDVYSVSDPDKICAQVIKPFEVNIPLGSFPVGKYTLWVNGEMVAEFQS